MSVNRDFQPCSARKSLTLFKKTGKERIQRCHEPTAEKHAQTVEPGDCEDCLVRVAITQAAIRSQEYHPPLVAEIREIKKVVKDTTPLAGWLPCLQRNIAIIGGCCGHVLEIRVCDSIDCFRLGAEVNASMCRECPHRAG